MSVKVPQRRRSPKPKNTALSDNKRNKNTALWIRAGIYLADWYNLHLLRKAWSTHRKMSLAQTFHYLVEEKLLQLKMHPIQNHECNSAGRLNVDIEEAEEVHQISPIKIHLAQPGRQEWEKQLTPDVKKKKGIQIVNVPSPVPLHEYASRTKNRF